MTMYDSRPAAVGVSAHRGASLEKPENTLAAFAHALSVGADGIELDLALTADGVAVVMHDRTVDRTTSGTGEVDELTLEELRALDAGDGERIPTLDEVLELVGDRAEVNIEIKAADAAAAVVETVRRHPGVRWFASSGQWDALAEVRRLDPEARLYPLCFGVATLDDMVRHAVEDHGYERSVIEHEMSRFSHLGRGLDDALRFADEVGAEGLSIWENGLTAAQLQHVHDAGRRAWVWTTNDAHRIAELIVMGADAICTDDPALAVAVRDETAG
jgi:glycerophosphoryl diester phosphodiesterase